MKYRTGLRIIDIANGTTTILFLDDIETKTTENRQQAIVAVLATQLRYKLDWIPVEDDRPGRAKSPAKTQAARKNGRRGGRPKKPRHG